MASPVGELVNEFHALGGGTSAENARKLGEYAHRRLRPLEPPLQRLFFETMKPRNRREELARIDLLRKYERHADSLAVLLEGGVISGRLTLKHEGLLQFIIAGHAGVEFTETMCTRIPYSVRTGLINKLSYRIKSEDAGFDYYSAVRAKYGFKTAEPLLIACQEDLIVEAMTVHGVKFAERQLIHCFKKSAKLLAVYFKENPAFDTYPKLARHLCLNDLKTFRSLLSRGVPGIGKGALVRFLREYKSDLLTWTGNFRPWLRHDVLKYFFDEDEFVTVTKNLLPRSVDDFEIMPGYLALIPRRMRGRVLFRAFAETYGFELWSDKGYKTRELLELLAVEDRRRFDLSDWPEFESVEIGIPALGQLSDSRVKALKMLKCCTVNRDLEALLELMKNVPQENLSTQFMGQLAKDSALGRFSDELWVCVDALVAKHHEGLCNNAYLCNLLRKCIEYKIGRRLDYLPQLKLYAQQRGYYAELTFSENPQAQREVLTRYHGLIDVVFKVESANRRAHCSYFNHVIAFNRKHPSCEVPLRYYQDSIKHTLEEISTYQITSAYSVAKLLKCIFKCGKKVDGLLREIYATCSNNWEPSTHTMFLKDAPDTLTRDLDGLFKRKLDHGFCYELAKLDQTDVQKEILEHARETLKSSSPDPTMVTNSVKLLWFYPDVNLIELTSHHEMVSEIIDELALVSKYHYGGANAVHFCKPRASKLLNYTFLHAPEHLLSDLINQLPEGRRLATHLVTIVGPLQLKRSVLTSKSLPRRFLAKKLFNIFLDDREEANWERFLSQSDALDPDDKEIIPRIPKTFYTNYLELVWNRRDSDPFALLEIIDYNKFQFNEFAEEIVREALLNPANHHQNATHVFICRYLSSEPLETHLSENLFAHLELLRSNATDNAKIATVWDIIRKASIDQSGFLEAIKFRKDLHGFLQAICVQALKTDEFTIVELMYANLDLLQIPGKFEMSLLLETTLYCKFGLSLDPELIALKLTQLVAEYGTGIAVVYAAFLGDFLKSVRWSQDGAVLLLLDGILGCDRAMEFRLFCVRMLPGSLSKIEAIREMYADVVERIRDGCDGVVEVELRAVLRNLEV